MKKKISVVFLVFFVIAVLSLSACGPGAVVTIGLSDTLPWASGTDTRVYERSVFEVRRYENVPHDNSECEDCADCRDFDQIAINIPEKSTVTYTLRQGWSLSFPTALNMDLYSSPRPVAAQNSALTLLQMELVVVYDIILDHPHGTGYLEGVREERVSSYAVFDSYNMAAVFSWRWARTRTVATLDGNDLVGKRTTHIMWVDYRDDYLNSFLIYYTAANTINSNSSRVVDAPRGQHHICNEYLFFLMRALNTTGPNASGQSIDFFLPLNALINNNRRVRSTTIMQQTTTSTVALPFSGAAASREFIEEHFNIDEETAARENFWDRPNIARRTTLMLNDNRSGPGILLYFSAYPVLEQNNPRRPAFALNKVLLQVVTHSHVSGDQFDRDFPIYTQVFSLIEYHNAAI